MDEHNNLSQVHSTNSGTNTFHSVGLTLVTPLNTPALPSEYLEYIWLNVKTQEYMFNDFERGNREGFLARLLDMRHLHLDIGGDGYCILLNAWCCDSPELHFCIWNPKRPFKKTLEAAKEVVRFVFTQMNVVRITAMFPAFHQDSVKLATLLGFRFEGELRRGVLYMGRHYNVSIYGLLKEDWMAKQEALNGRQ